MLIENLGVQEALRGMVGRFARDPSLREDLMQEALVHLWQMEQARPDCSRSWYIQSCHFRLQHFLMAGRSVDSMKRASRLSSLTSDEEVSTDLSEHLRADEDASDDSGARDIVSALASRLAPRERAVLNCLAEGLPVREICQKLKISYPTALKCRRRIANLAVKMGIRSDGWTARGHRIWI